MTPAVRHARIALLAATVVGGAEHTAHAKACPNLMLVLDQSGSMAEDPTGGMDHPSKWELLQQVMSDVVRQYGDHVPFGLELFSSNSFHDDNQCYADTMITVELSHASAGEIIQKIGSNLPVAGAHTNTGEAIARAAADMALMDPNKPNFIILVTDGDPSCNSQDVMSGTADYTVTQLQAAADANPSIKTYVVGFDGGGANKANLDRMAGAGGARVPGCQGSSFGTPCYYSASNAQAFEDAITKIVTEVGGEFGGGICDDSCYTIPCPAGQRCTTTETDPSPHCENDPCGGMSCGGGEFCRLGKCVKSCDSCAEHQTCQDGRCVADLCGTKQCPDLQICNPSAGNCIPSPCPVCAGGGVCDIPTGHCLADQCKIISCPGGTSCVNNGNCLGHGGGCSAGRAGSAGTLGAFALALCAVAALLHRRRRQGERAPGAH